MATGWEWLTGFQSSQSRNGLSFPIFKDGDVSITITTSRVYQLHAVVLRRNSKFFNDLLTEERALEPTAKNKREGKMIRYWVDFKLSDDGNSGQFMLRDAGNRARTGGLLQFLEVENGKISNELYHHYDNLFKALYNLKISFDDTNMATVLKDSVGLIDAAEELGSVDAVNDTAEIALLRQGNLLFRSIAGNPSAWSDLSMRLSSPTIFKEAVVHLVGQWQSMSVESRSRLRPEIIEVCEAKYAALYSMKKTVESKIAGHYPSSLIRPTGMNPGRTSYGSDIYMWMAGTLFRHWFAQCLAQDRAHNAKDGGASFYRLLATGGYAYLDRNTMIHFHQHFPMTQKGNACLENAMSNFKEEIKTLVEDLLVNNSQLDVEKHHTPYLTCCEVTKADYPWNQVEAVPHGQAAAGSVESEKGDDDEKLVVEDKNVNDGDMESDDGEEDDGE